MYSDVVVLTRPIRSPSEIRSFTSKGGYLISVKKSWDGRESLTESPNRIRWPVQAVELLRTVALLRLCMPIRPQ